MGAVAAFLRGRKGGWREHAGGLSAHRRGKVPGAGDDAERRRRPSHRSEVGAAASGDHVRHSSDCDRNRKVPDLGFP